MMPDKQPVEVQNEEPIDVAVVMGPEMAGAEQARATEARARVEANVLRSEGQRQTSNIWEHTQQAIALSVVLTTEAAILFIVFTHESDSLVNLSLTVLFGMVNLVIGFYFGRTNHQRVGGVGGDEVMGPR